MKSVVMVGLAVLLACAGWFGWTKYQSLQETKFAAQAAQSSAAQTERQLKARKEDGITFSEYFKRGCDVIAALDQTVSELDAREWDHQPADRDIALAFIEQCKALIRSDQTETRLVMQERTTREATAAAKKELDEADSKVSIDWSLKRYQTLSSELVENLQNQITTVQESTGKIERLVASDEAVKTRFGAEKGFSMATVEALKRRAGMGKKDPSSNG